MAKGPGVQVDVGLAITEEYLLAVGVQHVHGKAQVAAHGVVELPRGAVEGSSVAEPQVVGEALRKLRRELNLQSRSACVVMLSPGYAMRALRLPDIPAAEQRTLVRGELEETGALPFGGGAFDFLWVPLPPTSNKRQADAYAYYTSDATVDGIREALRQAGFQLECLEPSSLAMMRAYLAAMPRRQPIALLCPSERHSDLCIHDGTQIRHLRRIPAGWAEFDQRDASGAGMGLSRGLIEDGGIRSGTPEISPMPFLDEPNIELAREEAVPPPPDESGGTSSTGLRRISSIAFLASEVMRSLAFYAREYEEWARPEALAIVGTADVAEDFRGTLERNLSIPVIDTDALAAYELSVPLAPFSDTKTRNGYLATIGTALGDVEPAIPRVDTSQQELAARTRRRAPAVILAGMATSTVWMILSAVAAVTLTILESNKEAESVRLAQEITATQDKISTMVKQREISDAAKSAAASAQVPAASVMGRLAAATTPGVEVTNLHVMPDGQVIIEGKALTEASLAHFVDSLGLGKAVQQAYPASMRPESRGRGSEQNVGSQAIEFRVVGRFRPPAPPPAAAPAAPSSNP